MKAIYLYTFFIPLFFLSCADSNNQTISILELEKPVDIANLFATETIFPITEDIITIRSNLSLFNSALIVYKAVDRDSLENLEIEYNKILKLINDGIKKINNTHVPEESLLIKKQSISYLQYLKKFHIETSLEQLTLLQNNKVLDWDSDLISPIIREVKTTDEWVHLYSTQIRKYCFQNDVFVESGVSNFIDESMPYLSQCTNTSDTLYQLLNNGENLILNMELSYHLIKTVLNPEDGNILDTLNISYDQFNYISCFKNLNSADSNQKRLVKAYDLAQPGMRICEGIQIRDSLKSPFIELCNDNNNIYIKNSTNFSYYIIKIYDGVINEVTYEYIH